MGVASKVMNSAKPAIGYPKLMFCEDSKGHKLIVLFQAPGRGMIVHGDHQPVGNFYEYWDMDTFKDYHGQVTIENV